MFTIIHLKSNYDVSIDQTHCHEELASLCEPASPVTGQTILCLIDMTHLGILALPEILCSCSLNQVQIMNLSALRLMLIFRHCLCAFKNLNIYNGKSDTE